MRQLHTDGGYIPDSFEEEEEEEEEVDEEESLGGTVGLGLRLTALKAVMLMMSRLLLSLSTVKYSPLTCDFPNCAVISSGVELPLAVTLYDTTAPDTSLRSTLLPPGQAGLVLELAVVLVTVMSCTERMEAQGASTAMTLNSIAVRSSISDAWSADTPSSVCSIE